jgi:hypothetical protein
MFDYLYVDWRRADDYLAQLNATEPHKQRRNLLRLKLPIAQYEAEETVAATRRDPHAVATTLLAALDRAALIAYMRPTSASDAFSKACFTLERTIATKYIIPSHGKPDMVLWMSDPPSDAMAGGEKWKVSPACFLYLIESCWDDDAPYRSHLSPLSALQVLVTKAAEEFGVAYPFDLWADKYDEPFGRSFAAHPADKLGLLGIQASGTQIIDVLYRKRYLSDEQLALHDGMEVRAYDLLAYPIFIRVPLT